MCWWSPCCSRRLPSTRTGSGGLGGLALAAAICLLAGWAAEAFACVLQNRVMPLALMLLGMTLRMVPPLGVCVALAAQGISGRAAPGFYLLSAGVLFGDARFGNVADRFARRGHEFAFDLDRTLSPAWQNTTNIPNTQHTAAATADTIRIRSIRRRCSATSRIRPELHVPRGMTADGSGHVKLPQPFKTNAADLQSPHRQHARSTTRSSRST